MFNPHNCRFDSIFVLIVPIHPLNDLKKEVPKKPPSSEKEIQKEPLKEVQKEPEREQPDETESISSNINVMNKKKLQKLNLDKLKEKCMELGLSVEGTKAQLIDRLLEN